MALPVKNLTCARSEVRGVCESDTLREAYFRMAVTVNPDGSYGGSLILESHM